MDPVGYTSKKQSSQVHMSSWSSRNCHRDLLAHTRSMYGNVWYIYLELPLKSTIHVGKYTCPMDPMGMINLSISLKDSPRVLPKHWFTVVSRWKKQVPFIEITVWIDYLRNLQYLAVNQAFGSPQPIASLKLWMNWLFTNCYRVWATPHGIQVNFRLHRIRNSFHNFWLCDVLCMTCPGSCLFFLRKCLASFVTILTWYCL